MLALALRRVRCLLHSIPVSQTRALGTNPRPIPIYLKRWNPTLHSPIRPSKPHVESSPGAGFLQKTTRQTLPASATDDPRSLAEQPSQDRHVVIQTKSRSLQTRHAFKKLQYLLNLADSNDDLNPTLRAPLWAAYKLAMKYNVSLPQYLSDRAWNILWRSQYADFSDPSRRHVHLAKLDRDLTRARSSPVAGQVAHRVQQKFMAGMQEQALKAWAASQDTFAIAPDYLDTGARLYALAGYPDQAKSIMDRLLQVYPGWHPSVMMAVFRAYTSSGSEQHLEKARELYRTMKERLESQILFEFYDSCLIGFLEARSFPDAKEVFQDMARGIPFVVEDRDRYAENFMRRLNMLYSVGTDISSMSSIALNAIAVLPVAFHGHVFSDWMKCAMFEKAPEASAQILDVMIQRGYRPETEHFDYLLRTLFRTKEPEHVSKAEKIAWKMVEEALQSSIALDRHPSGSQTKDIAERLSNLSVPDPDLPVSLPAASASTFALLMRHHASNSQWEHVDYLTRQLQDTNVWPNTTIMNVLIENKCRKGQFVEAMKVYKTLTKVPDVPGSVFPDGETMRILWRTLRIALSTPENRNDSKLPSPRQLLRETVAWWAKVRRRPDADRFLQGLAADNKGAIMKLMLHSFSFDQDLSGSLVALHVLRSKFNIYPTREDARIIIRQQAWEAMHDETSSVRKQFGIGKHPARNMLKISRAYEYAFSDRLKKMKITEDQFREYTPEQQGKVELNTISSFVRYLLLGVYDPTTTELLIEGAANAVGVTGIYTGDENVRHRCNEVMMRVYREGFSPPID